MKGRLEFAFDYVPKCEKLLDIGCDKGEFSNKYLKRSKKVYAIDSNKESIIEAKKKIKEVVFKTAPAEKIPFPSNYFDVVTMTDTLEHVQNEGKTLKEVYRILKPSGILILSVPYKGLFRCLDSFNMKFYFPKIYKWFKCKEYALGIYKEAPWHRHYSLKEIKGFFKNKFIIEKKHRGGLFLFPLCNIINDSIFWKFKKTPNFIKLINNFLMRLDYNIPYGSLAYHIILVARIKK